MTPVIVTEEFFTGSHLGGASPQARLLFLGLVAMADGDETLRYSPRRICYFLFPYDETVSPEDVDGWVRELEALEALRVEQGADACWIELAPSAGARPDWKEEGAHGLG